MSGDERARSRRSARFFEINTGQFGSAFFGATDDDHLATEVIAAYVDGELRMNAYMRASQHLGRCAECAAEVDAQRQASGALRRAAKVSMPSNLLGALSQIPCEYSGPPELDIHTVMKRWTQWWRR